MGMDASVVRVAGESSGLGKCAAEIVDSYRESKCLFNVIGVVKQTGLEGENETSR
jgi:hypothetical protein